MVCLGNICRSPLAEGILRHKATQLGLNWEIDSAGTGSWHVGEKPDSRSIAVAAKYGIDISKQRSRQFRKKDFAYFDRIFVMDASNYQNVMRLTNSPTDRAKVMMIRNLVLPNYNEAVPDPYWNSDGFEKVYRMLDEACDIFIQEYQKIDLHFRKD